MQVLDATVNHQKLDAIIDAVFQSPSFNDNTRLMMSGPTLKAIGGRYFYDDRHQQYNGIDIIQNEKLQYGEVVVLTQFC